MVPLWSVRGDCLHRQIWLLFLRRIECAYISNVYWLIRIHSKYNIKSNFDSPYDSHVDKRQELEPPITLNVRFTKTQFLSTVRSDNHLFFDTWNQERKYYQIYAKNPFSSKKSMMNFHRFKVSADGWPSLRNVSCETSSYDAGASFCMKIIFNM